MKTSAMLLISTFGAAAFVHSAALTVAMANALLPAEQAFELSVERVIGDGVNLHWKIAEGYYLYRAHLAVHDTATGTELKFDSEPGVMELDDQNFGPSEVFYEKASAHVGGNAPTKINVTYQGCKRGAICYPPITVTLDMSNLQLSDMKMGF